MKKRLMAVALVIALVAGLGVTSALALGYTGTGNKLSASGGYATYGETKTTAGRYNAVNTGEAPPNPGQLVGPSSLRWDVSIYSGSYAAYNQRIGKNSRSSSYIYDDSYAPNTSYVFFITNDSSTSATYGMTYTCNATN